MQFSILFYAVSCRIAVTAVRWVCVCEGKGKVVKCISTSATLADTSSSPAARRERRVLLRLRSRKNRGLNRPFFLREVKYLSFSYSRMHGLQCVTCSFWLISSGWSLGWVRVYILFWRTDLDGLSCHESVVMEAHRMMWNHTRTWNVSVLSCIFNTMSLLSLHPSDFWVYVFILTSGPQLCLFLKPGLYLEASEVWLCLGIQFHIQVPHTAGREVDIDGSEERKMPRADRSGVTLPFSITHKDAGKLGWIRSRWQSRLLPLCPCQQTFLLSQMFQLTTFTNFGRICMETLFSFWISIHPVNYAICLHWDNTWY